MRGTLGSVRKGISIRQTIRIIDKLSVGRERKSFMNPARPCVLFDHDQFHAIHFPTRCFKHDGTGQCLSESLSMPGVVHPKTQIRHGLFQMPERRTIAWNKTGKLQRWIGRQHV